MGRIAFRHRVAAALAPARLLALSLIFAASGSAARSPGQYIVVLEDLVADPEGVVKDHGQEHGVQRSELYRYARGCTRTQAVARGCTRALALARDGRKQ